MNFRAALYEGSGALPLDSARRTAILRELLQKGHGVSSIRSGGAVTRPSAGVLLVLGAFTGDPPGDFEENGVSVAFADIAQLDALAVSSLVEERRALAAAPKPGHWKPWFPVIDYSRCTNCMQCLSFCLFDVYGVSKDNKIQVQNESNCKTECPACSRVCPEVAILFPKYRHSPINGDEVGADDVRREAMKVDISALLGGDIYAALRDRSAKFKSRFSKERDEERAIKERQTCLVSLTKEAGIPPEVLASLPSPEEILRRAEAAKAKARQAIENNAASSK
jgi:NAD-dependent dihydropyrimidine dehydrogenase PreA subunit